MIDPTLLGQAALIAACLAACWFDVRQRIIPNWLCLLTLIAGLGFTLWVAPAAIGWHALHAAVALLVGMGLFAMRWIGGGDAKFYAAVAGWFTWFDGLHLLFSVSIAALVMILGWLALRRLRGIPYERKATADGAKFPYALGIAGGAVLALLVP